MRFLQLRGFNVDANGMKMSVPEEEREPIWFFLMNWINMTAAISICTGMLGWS